jgi:uncharacterized BrkB/YihY/UPF0761 family membrane protein
VSLALLVWSTFTVFRGLDVAFSQVYGTSPAASFLGRVRDALVALASIGGGLAALVVTNALIGLSVVFFPLFYLFPDQGDPPALVVPGTVVAAGCWTLLGTGFRVYTGVVGGSSVYGVLGGALLLVTWYYVGSMALLVGAGVNAVLAGRADETGTNKSPPPDSQPNDSV